MRAATALRLAVLILLVALIVRPEWFEVFFAPFIMADNFAVNLTP